MNYYLTAVILDNEYRVAQICKQGQEPHITLISYLHLSSFITNADLNKFKIAVNKCQFISEEEIQEYKAAIFFEEIYPHLTDYYGTKILQEILNSSYGLELSNKIEFAADSDLCKFAFVLNLDKNKLEIYIGHQHVPSQQERTFDLASANIPISNNSYPISFEEEFELNEDGLKQLLNSKILTKITANLL